MSTFKHFGLAVQATFNQFSSNELYTVAVDGDELYALYLASFPAGTDPIYKVATEHTCSCCKNFIRNLGNVVSIVDGVPVSIWRQVGLEYPYNVVAEALTIKVESAMIDGIYRAEEPSYGAGQSVLVPKDGGPTVRFDHFHGKGVAATAAQTLKRAFEELKPDAIAEVLSLIEAGTLYRGAEFKGLVTVFDRYYHGYHAQTSDAKRNAYIWVNSAPGAVAGFKNTVIGTLVSDLSSGLAVEDAVRMYESKVAPANYKRPTALVTPKMIAAAMKVIEERGLEPSTERRHAKLSDVSVNDVLWADGSAKPLMKGGLESLLLKSLPLIPVAVAAKAIDIGVEEFLREVLPKSSGMELLMQNRLTGNLMSLTAPVHADAKPLFKWSNNFAWSYNGNVTDSIRERVKAAGGNVDAKLRVSLAWGNPDDLDIHAITPGGAHVYYGQRYGVLDVDANGINGLRDDPVENLAWDRVSDGVYKIQVDQFNKRSSENVGFDLELAMDGQTLNWRYAKAVNSKVKALEITIAAGKLADVKVMDAGLVTSSSSKEVWGLKTEQWAKVETLMLSPNFWHGQTVGNKHWLFVLEGCNNPEPVRGIYNEFLLPELEVHRKAFELIGNKTKCQPAAEQLSGVGLSGAKGDTAQVRVTAEKSSKVYNIKF
jgi:hypothetical protein